MINNLTVIFGDFMFFIASVKKFAFDEIQVIEEDPEEERKESVSKSKLQPQYD